MQQSCHQIYLLCHGTGNSASPWPVLRSVPVAASAPLRAPNTLWMCLVPKLGKELLLRSHLAIVSWNLFDSLTLSVPVFNSLFAFKESLCMNCWLPSTSCPSHLAKTCYRWKMQGIFIEKTSQILLHALGVLHNHIKKYESPPKELVIQLMNNKNNRSCRTILKTCLLGILWKIKLKSLNRISKRTTVFPHV